MDRRTGILYRNIAIFLQMNIPARNSLLLVRISSVKATIPRQLVHLILQYPVSDEFPPGGLMWGGPTSWEGLISRVGDFNVSE